MTFSQYAKARQLLAEEQVGAALRYLRRQEDAKFDQSLDRIRKDTQMERIDGSG